MSTSARPQRSAMVLARNTLAEAAAIDRQRQSRSPSSSLSPIPPSPPPQQQANGDADEYKDEPVAEEKTNGKAGKRELSSPPATPPPEPKKRRTRKPKEPEVFVIPPIEQISTTFKGRLGYACLNTILRKLKPPVFCSRTCRIDTIKNEEKGMPYLKELGRQNMIDLKQIIEWNAAHNIFFMRMSSEMFPFAGHIEYGYSLEYAAKELKEAGDTAKRLGVRLSTHPGQFNQLGSPRRPVVENTFRDLEYHNEMMDRMGLDQDGVMIIHGGGVYNDKPTTIERFKKTYPELSQGVKNRLVLENDEMCYNVDDLLPICEELNIPLVLDYHHDWIYPSSQSLEELMPRILATWSRKGIRTKFHLSEPRRGAETLMERRAHADRCQNLPTPLPDDIDLMIEAKDKEQAVFHLFRRYGLHPVDHDALRPPALEETTQTAGRKSSKKKTPKKGVKGEEDESSATDATIEGSVNELEDELDKEENMLEHGLAPLPEGLNAEGQAINPPVDGSTTPAKAKGKGKAKAKATPDGEKKKKTVTPRKKKVKEEVTGDEEQDEAVKPAKKARKPRTPKAVKKEVDDEAVNHDAAMNTDEDNVVKEESK